MYQHAQITVIDGGIFLDGGSIRIEAEDPLQIHYSIYLERSFKSQDSHTTQLYLNEKPLLKNSSEEILWLQLLQAATYQSDSDMLNSLLDEPWTKSPVDVADVLQKAETNPVWMSKYLVHQVVSHIQSPEYHKASEEVLIRL